LAATAHPQIAVLAEKFQTGDSRVEFGCQFLDEGGKEGEKLSIEAEFDNPFLLAHDRHHQSSLQVREEVGSVLELLDFSEEKGVITGVGGGDSGEDAAVGRGEEM
jgi:hypothetical protein